MDNSSKGAYKQAFGNFLHNQAEKAREDLNTAERERGKEKSGGDVPTIKGSNFKVIRINANQANHRMAPRQNSKRDMVNSHQTVRSKSPFNPQKQFESSEKFSTSTNHAAIAKNLIQRNMDLQATEDTKEK